MQAHRKYTQIKIDPIAEGAFRDHQLALQRIEILINELSEMKFKNKILNHECNLLREMMNDLKERYESLHRSFIKLTSY